MPRVYKQKKITFLLYENKVVVVTNADQKFILEPDRHYWETRLRTMRTMIELGEIRDLSELASWCYKDGKVCINWVSTFQDFPFDMQVALA